MQKIFIRVSLFAVLVLATADGFNPTVWCQDPAPVRSSSNLLTDDTLNSIQNPSSAASAGSQEVIPAPDTEEDQQSSADTEQESDGPGPGFLAFMAMLSLLVAIAVLTAAILSIRSMRRSRQAVTEAFSTIESEPILSGESRASAASAASAASPVTAVQASDIGGESPLKSSSPANAQAAPEQSSAGGKADPSALEGDVDEFTADPSAEEEIPVHDPPVVRIRLGRGQEHEIPPRRDDPKMRELLQKFNTLRREGMIDESREVISEIESCFPASPHVSVCRGLLYELDGEWESALREYQLAINTDPSSPNAYLRKARVLERQQHFAQARAMYRTVLKKVA
jgi:hypothetical protein